jgi:hypothetical protein
VLEIRSLSTADCGSSRIKREREREGEKKKVGKREGETERDKEREHKGERYTVKQLANVDLFLIWNSFHDNEDVCKREREVRERGRGERKSGKERRRERERRRESARECDTL